MADLGMNFTPFYIMANVRRILPDAYNKRTQNWVLAMELFAVGSATGHRICFEANIAADGYEVKKVAAIAKEPTK